jgi:hypothetical protein
MKLAKEQLANLQQVCRVRDIIAHFPLSGDTYKILLLDLLFL